MEIKDYLNLITNKKDLTKGQAKGLLNLLVNGETTPVQIAAVLTGLATKGETIDEIVGFAEGMRELMIPVKTIDGAIDIVGTGGDGKGSINISTISAMVVAGTGVRVAKHGNRAASSKCGSADVLEALGVNINLDSKKAGEVLEKAGMVFLFAPQFHPAMKVVGSIRKELKIKTIFNYLGPFLNPGKVKRMLLGVSNLEIGKKFLEIAKKLNFEHLIIVTSSDGLDEISVADKTTAFELKNGKVRKFIIDPLKLGFGKYKTDELIGGDVKMNAGIAKAILSGKEIGVKREAIILNSGYGLVVAGKVKNIEDGIKMAREVIDSGRALEVLEKLKEESNSDA